MVNIGDIYFLMTLGFSLAAPLGPVNMEMIKQSLKSKLGFLLGIFTGLGAMTGDFIIASVVLYVGNEYLRNLIDIPVIYVILLIMNIFILSYIGISALRSEPPNMDHLDIDKSDENLLNDQKGSSFSIFDLKKIATQMTTGFVIVVTSPWSYFWWTSFGGYIANSGLPLATNAERLIVTMFFLAGILLWVLLFCGILGVSRKLASPKILNYITKGSALIILGFAVKILYDGIVYLV